MGPRGLAKACGDIRDEELKKFCSRVVNLLQKDELGPDAVDALQRLFLIVSATKYKRKSPWDDRSELEGSTLSVLSAGSTAGRLLPPRERLREKAFEYCQRLAEQSTRRALRKGDSDLQKACLVEAVLVLDVLCRQDPSFLYRTLSCLKALHARLCGDPARVRTLLPIAQFFLNHGEAAAVDSEAILRHLLTRTPSEFFHSPMLAFELTCFCRDNLPLFGRNLDILKRSFPNLFKMVTSGQPFIREPCLLCAALWVLSSRFLALCALHPSLVVELAKELLEFVGSVSGIQGRGAMLASVVWAVGEYLSVSWDRRCTVEQINRFFEALEAVLFEVTQSRPSAALPRCPPQVVTVLMTTLTKLASRSQDLIPRVSLFLSKMRTPAQSPAPSSTSREEDAGAVRTRAAELLTLLKMPSVAQFVLTPSTEVSEPRYHRDANTALPLALRTVSRLVEKETGLLPG
ncbi:AP-5 complex subunit zeta-1 [Puma concolor]|uniref:AP-5 complex subunit zeta-1 n=1 Tax=Puma concolor TaxID=9696 RepID=A0A6P6HSZ6_PUMCO|nr:AP-5 complex subunit zeta-1 [Puma concolor]